MQEATMICQPSETLGFRSKWWVDLLLLQGAEDLCQPMVQYFAIFLQLMVNISEPLATPGNFYCVLDQKPGCKEQL